MSDEILVRTLEDRDLFTIEATLGELKNKQYERTITQNHRKILELERQILLHKLDDQARKLELAGQAVNEAVVAETNAHQTMARCRTAMAAKYKIETENWGYDPLTAEIKE
jgi:hypothetical protein